jgi:polar amino acid transport system substrate-binding protein
MDNSGDKAVIDLNEITRTALRLVDATIRKTTGHFQAQLEEGIPRIRGNAQRIEQVVVNLIINACQALPDPERGITVSTHYNGALKCVVLRVHDQGTGIQPEHLNRLTDPFFTTKRDRGGTGLGLSVSAGIVKEHGGSLSFESTLGVGTTVSVTLPAVREDTA